MWWLIVSVSGPGACWLASQWLGDGLGSVCAFMTVHMPYGKCRIKKARSLRVRKARYPTRLGTGGETEEGSPLVR